MKLIYVDTETTGLDPKLHEIWQLAFIIEIDGHVCEERKVEMRIEHPETVAVEALKVSNKTITELQAYEFTHKDVLHSFKQRLAKYTNKFGLRDRYIWIGQNPRFDMDFVQELFLSQGDRSFSSWFDRRPVDLIGLAVASYLAGRSERLESYNLASICKSCGFEFKAHDALEDVRALRRAFLVHVECMRKDPIGEVLDKALDKMP